MTVIMACLRLYLTISRQNCGRGLFVAATICSRKLETYGNQLFSCFSALGMSSSLVLFICLLHVLLLIISTRTLPRVASGMKSRFQTNNKKKDSSVDFLVRALEICLKSNFHI